jgi:hypothetical protein
MEGAQGKQYNTDPATVTLQPCNNSSSNILRAASSSTNKAIQGILYIVYISWIL